jgi:IS30 family transposase
MPGLRLGLEERVEIAAGLARGDSYDEIAGVLGRHRSTVIREVTGNGGRARYRPVTAHGEAKARARVPRRTKLQDDPELAARIRKDLKHMSPVPLAHRLRAEGYRICGETIYRECYRPGSALGDDAWKRLRRKRPYRRRQRRTRTGRDTRPLGDLVLVSERRAVLPDEFGHWEGDLIVGSGSYSAAVVLTERNSRICLLGALRSQTTTEVVPVVANLLGQIPQQLRLSLCWDQGRELARWPQLVETLGIDVFFCRPRSPWEKPLVENTCGHLRRWLPKHSNLYRPQNELDIIANRLNTTPRRILNWNTALDQYHHLVATLE